MRYERGLLSSTANDKRVITIEFVNNTIQFSNNIIISINPNMKIKSASLTSMIANIGIYTTDDEDYQFLIYGSDKDKVTKVGVIMTDRNIKIEYLEN